jgi:ankyrin repeat protein
MIAAMQTDVVDAIRRGDVSSLRSFLTENPASVRARVDGQRTLLHVATDWPGHFPNVQETIRLLAEHGAELNAPFQGTHTETPLHWAASSDDVGALDALLDLGADIEAPGAIIGGGSPLEDAVAFGQWKTARRLIERGARSTLWQSAALGLMDRVREHFAGSAKPTPDEMTNAFWNACNGGQIEAAEFLLANGADRNWIGHNGLTPLDVAVHNGNEEVVNWLKSRGAISSKELS